MTAAGVSKCLEGTREEILNQIVAWVSQNEPGVFWLNGMAGHGKSTIAKTIAGKARVFNRLGASFFISRRSDPRLRDPTAIIPTIAYQLADFNHEYMIALMKATEERSDITVIDVDEQLDVLLRRPFSSVIGSTVTPVVVIDAFDELDGAGAHRLLQTLLLSMSRGSPLPIKFLITSRPETFIRNAFDSFQQSVHLFLHNIECSIVKADIQLYIKTSLEQIPRTLGLQLPQVWFQPEQLSALAEASGDLFVYAATAVRYVASNPPADPRSQLKALLTQSSDPTYFSSLDVLYLEILTDVAKARPNFQHEFRIIIGAMILLRDSLSVLALESLLGFSECKVHSSLMTVRSLVIYPDEPEGTVQFYHPSVAEFFMDKARCSDPNLFIDPVIHESNLATRCLIIIQSSRCTTFLPETLPAIVLYSSAHWASHISKAPFGDGGLIALVDTFARTDFLRWLEIMSVQKLISSAIKALQDAETWVVSTD